MIGSAHPLPRTGTLAVLALTALVPLAAGQAPAPAPVLPKPWKEIPVDRTPVRRAALSPDGKLVALTCAGDRCYALYDRAGSLLHDLRPPFGVGDGLLLFTPDSKRLLTHGPPVSPARTGPQIYGVMVWDVATGKAMRRFDLRRYQGLFRQHYGGSDKFLVAGGPDAPTTFYDLDTGKVLGVLPGGYRAERLALSPDGSWLLTLDARNVVSLWDAQRRALVRELAHPSAEVKALTLSPDGKWCAWMTKYNRVWVFDRVTGLEKARTDTLFHWHGGDSLIFSPDGKLLVACGSGARQGLMVWDWQTCKEVRGGYPKEGFEGTEMGDARWQWGGLRDIHLAADGQTLFARGAALYFLDLKAPEAAKAPAKPETPGK